MNQEEIATINTIIAHLDEQRRCSCTSSVHEEGCIVPMLLDLHRQANETRHQIIILKRDRDIEVAKRLAEEELREIYGAYTDHTVKIEQRELHDLYAANGLVGYLIRIDTSLTDEEVEEIKRKHYLREHRLLANIGQVRIDDKDIGRTYKEFFR